MFFANRLSPVARLSVGLVALLSLLLVLAHLFLDIFPDETAAAQKHRQKLAEGLAVQLTSLIEKDDRATLTRTLESLTRRGGEIISVGVRRGSELLVESGGHRAAWAPLRDGRSTVTQIAVPVYAQGEHWGDVEIQFKPLKRSGLAGALDEPAFVVLLLISVPGLLMCYLYLRRALQYLDPTAVIPERVGAAFDSLSEGVIILDSKARIVLANRAFRHLHPSAASDRLTGQYASRLPWLQSALPSDSAEHPWQRSLAQKLVVTGTEATIEAGTAREKKVLINAAPVLDDKGASRGCLVTFDDVSELSRKHSELQVALLQLEQSKEQIASQNEELQKLALRDPLTACLNRRAFMAQATTLLQQAQAQGTELCCIMSDIDHFKSYNDRFGHAVGDQVIIAVSKALQAKISAHALLCRYGGEEFCMLLPATQIDLALQVAENARKSVEASAAANISALRGLTVTSSFGVSALRFGATTVEQLIDQADHALYASKKSGRNRVSRFDAVSESVLA